MKFSDYYKNEGVVESYEEKRSKGIKSGIVRVLERAAIEHLMKNTGKNILEAGVGTGYITEILRKHGKVSGFDISPAMISKTKSKFPDMEIKKQDILNLKLSKKYDAIVSVRVISHFKFDDAKKALENLKKVAKPNASIIFNLENLSPLRRFLRKILRWGSTETYQYSSLEISCLARESGLKIKEQFYIDHFFILPLHVLNKILLNSLRRLIIKLELKLSKVKFASNNTFLSCQKLN